MIVLEPRDAQAFIELALDRMMSKAVALGPKVDERPDLDGTNSVFAIVVHCLGVAEWWLDHVVIGNPSTRDRAAEFSAAGTVDELDALVQEFRIRLPGLLTQVVETVEPASSDPETEFPSRRAWTWTTASIILHVVEELFQHAGHVDITADMLLA